VDQDLQTNVSHAYFYTSCFFSPLFISLRKSFRKGVQREGSVNESYHSDESVDSGEESDPSVIPLSGKKRYQCMNCQTEDSIRWRRSPSDTDRKRKQFKHVLCEECGVYWLKYSIKRPINNQKIKRQLENPETPMIKRKKSNEGAPRPILPKKQRDDTPHLPSKCKICMEIEPEDYIYTCQDCGMSVHNGKVLILVLPIKKKKIIYFFFFFFFFFINI
jgi:hypothetical protein